MGRERIYYELNRQANTNRHQRAGGRLAEWLLRQQGAHPERVRIKTGPLKLLDTLYDAEAYNHAAIKLASEHHIAIEAHRFAEGNVVIPRLRTPGLPRIPSPPEMFERQFDVVFVRPMGDEVTHDINIPGTTHVAQLYPPPEAVAIQDLQDC